MARLARCGLDANTPAGYRIPIMIADAPTATARRKQIAMRGRVDEPGVRFAQSQPPRASSSGRRAARAGLPPDTVRGRRMDISNFELELWVMREKWNRERPES